MSIVPIGIDLGTNNSCISFVEGSAIKCVPNPISKANTHASVVYIPPSASIKNAPVTVGQEALNSGQTQPKQMIYCVKRLIGQSQVPPSNNFGYDVKSDDGCIMIEVPQTDADSLIYSPVDIYSFILSYLRRSAEVFFNPPDLDGPQRIYRTAEKCVITVPAAFNSVQREMTRTAARLAGLDCLRILSEPTAAAMSYIYSHYHDPNFQEQRLDPEKPINLLMFDLGGGTFDVSIVSVAKEGFQVRSTAGNNHYGGEDIDSKIAEDIKRQYAKEAKVPFPTSERATRQLRKESQRLKEKLSEQVSHMIDVEKSDWDLAIDFKWEYKRSRLEALLSREFEKSCVPVVHDALDKAGLVPGDIYQCVLVGGSTRIPYFRSQLEKLLNLPISRAINPDEAVSKGAAYLASFLVNKQLKQQGYGSEVNSSSASKSGLQTSLLDFTQVSLARGELSAFAYSIASGDDQPIELIGSGSELPATGEHTFFLRHTNINDPLFDHSPITFYILEGQDRKNGGTTHEPPRRLFEISVARQKTPTQTVSFYCQLDSDGVLDVFVVDEDEHYQIPNIDLPEIQALVAQTQLGGSVSIASPTNQSMSRHHSPFALSRPSPGPGPSSPTSTGSSPEHSVSKNTANRRPSAAFLTTKRLPIKVPQNISTSAGKPGPTLQAPPAPRAPIFERIPDPPEVLSLAKIPPAPLTAPMIPATLADRFFAGYANPEFIYMRQYYDLNGLPGSLSSGNFGGSPTIITPGQLPTMPGAPQPPSQQPTSIASQFGSPARPNYGTDVTLNLPARFTSTTSTTIPTAGAGTGAGAGPTTLSLPIDLNSVSSLPTRPTPLFPPTPSLNNQNQSQVASLPSPGVRRLSTQTPPPNLPPPGVRRPSTTMPPTPAASTASTASTASAASTVLTTTTSTLPPAPSRLPPAPGSNAPGFTNAPSPPMVPVPVPSRPPPFAAPVAPVAPVAHISHPPSGPALPPIPPAQPPRRTSLTVNPFDTPAPVQPPSQLPPQPNSEIQHSRRDSNPFGVQPQHIPGATPRNTAPLPPIPTMSLPPPPAAPPPMRPPTLPPTMKPPGSR